ncbi:1-phosphofructokinase family hexose kinase [Rubellimicrobium rubrum]|uniref:Phosphofructokinase n=1 Tax=Rubellimicrobium rubrum TaxID=2585369 RepID=A0A5C4MUH4_9RHOB|nr:1-phosphofructokinase family hexose kinase [Rubellimicrobium rubrum]TNC49016.1 1-phosphofructokinase family hexose kinase [Rubellimicrobium rubrum]
MRDILTVTLNPALDFATSVDSVAPGVKLRCAPTRTDPGGGGINVSRAIALLGGTSRCVVALAGRNGEALADLLREAGIELIVHKAPGETRSSLSVRDEKRGEQYRFMLPGPPWGPMDVIAAEKTIVESAQPGGLVVISGTMPPGVLPQLVPDLCGKLQAKGCEVVVDTSGPSLHLLARANGTSAPDVLRMNQEEADDLAGRKLLDINDSADFAQSLVRRGVARMVIVARGPEGSVLATEGQRFHSRAADVPVRSKVGAGDTFVGSFTLALARGEPLEEALRRGVAGASAAVMTEGTALCRREDVERLLEICPTAPI